MERFAITPCWLRGMIEMDKCNFACLARMGFLKEENKSFTAVRSRCRQNLKYENLRPSFGRLRQKIATKSVLHRQHDYFSTNQVIDLWLCLFLNSLNSLLRRQVEWRRRNDESVKNECMNVYMFQTTYQSRGFQRTRTLVSPQNTWADNIWCRCSGRKSCRQDCS